MEKITPKSITANRTERRFFIEWNDGHSSAYPFGLIRAACPCASCRGGHENMSSEPDPTVFDKAMPESPETRLVKIEAAGAYGIVIEWEDGHHYGIYNWHFLRALCPCVACRRTL
jgi:DUF971 family protein